MAKETPLSFGSGCIVVCLRRARCRPTNEIQIALLSFTFAAGMRATTWALNSNRLAVSIFHGSDFIILMEKEA